MIKKEVAGKKVIKAMSIGMAAAMAMMQPMAALAEPETPVSPEPSTPEIVEDSKLPTVQEVVKEATAEVEQAQEAASDVVISIDIPLVKNDIEIPLEKDVEVLEGLAENDLNDAKHIISGAEYVIDKKGLLEDVVIGEDGEIVDVEDDHDETAIDDKSINDINATADIIDQITEGSVDEESGEKTDSIEDELNDAVSVADDLLNSEEPTYEAAVNAASDLATIVEKTQTLVDEADAAYGIAATTLADAEKKYEEAKAISDKAAGLAALEVEKAKAETDAAYNKAARLHGVLDGAKNKLDSVQNTIHALQEKNAENIAKAQENLADAKDALEESVENLKEEAGELQQSVVDFKDQVGELKDSIDNFVNKVDAAKDAQDTLDGLFGEYYNAKMEYENAVMFYNSAIKKWNDWAQNYENLTDEQKAQVELAVGAENLDKICKGMTNLIKVDEEGKPVYGEDGRVVLSDDVQKDAMAAADQSLIYQLYNAVETAGQTLGAAEELYNKINDENVNSKVDALAKALENVGNEAKAEKEALGAALIQKYLADGATVTWVEPGSELEGTYGKSEEGYYVVTSEGEDGFDVYGYTYDENGTLNIVSTNSNVIDHFKYGEETYDVVNGKVTIDDKEYTLSTDGSYFIDQEEEAGTKETITIPGSTTATLNFKGNKNGTDLEVSKTDKDGVYEMTFTQEMKEKALEDLETKKNALDAQVEEELAPIVADKIAELQGEIDDLNTNIEKEKKKGFFTNWINIGIWEAEIFAKQEVKDNLSDKKGIVYKELKDGVESKYSKEYSNLDYTERKVALSILPSDGSVKFIFTKEGDKYSTPSYQGKLTKIMIDLPFLEITKVTTTPTETYDEITVGGTKYRLNSDDNGAFYEKDGQKVYVEGIKGEGEDAARYYAKHEGTFTQGTKGPDSVYSIGDIAKKTNYKNEQADVSSSRYTLEKNETYSAFTVAQDGLDKANETYKDAVNQYIPLEEKFDDYVEAAAEKNRTDLVVKGIDNPIGEFASSILPGSDTIKLLSGLGSGADLANLPKGIADLFKVEDIKLITDAEKLTQIGNSLKDLSGKDASVIDKVNALKTISEFMPSNIDINAMVTAYIIANASDMSLIDGTGLLKKMNVSDFQIEYASAWVDAVNAKAEVVGAGLDVANETGKTIASGLEVIKEGVETGEAITDTTLKSVEVAIKAVALGGAKMDKGILAVADLIVDKLDNFVSDLEAKAEKAKDEAYEAQQKVNNLELTAPQSQELAMARKALDDANAKLKALGIELDDLKGTLEEAKRLQGEAQDLAKELYREPVNNNGGNQGGDDNQYTPDNQGDSYDAAIGGGNAIQNAVILTDEDMQLFAQAVADQAVLGARKNIATKKAANETVVDDEAVVADNGTEAVKEVVIDDEKTKEEETKAPVEIKDEDVALAATLPIEDEKAMSWWWLLIVAVLGGTGYELYRKNQAKKKEVEK